ncbi:hypothetical protein FUAX_30380 [Fulvitalea axinellae]|uniref:DUF4249 family protein n=1 Tax=Fulvitalea axinellae TaxID=1182444 RepID=A0AAU9CNB9_9BACT|nr:hypothetical protein FUAX_30380 [Fulvitalea axinellae]
MRRLNLFWIILLLMSVACTDNDEENAPMVTLLYNGKGGTVKVLPDEDITIQVGLIGRKINRIELTKTELIPKPDGGHEEVTTNLSIGNFHFPLTDPSEIEAFLQNSTHDAELGKLTYRTTIRLFAQNSDDNTASTILVFDVTEYPELRTGQFVLGSASQNLSDPSYVFFAPGNLIRYRFDAVEADKSDLGYVYTESINNKATVFSPDWGTATSGEIEQGTQNWATRKETRFVRTDLSQADFDNVTTTQGLRELFRSKDYNPDLAAVNQLQEESKPVLAVRLSDGRIGLLLVDEISGTTAGRTTIMYRLEGMSE